MAVITISRAFGSGGDEIARSLCQELGYQLFDKALVVQAAKEAGFAEGDIIDLSEDSYKFRGALERLLSRTPVIPYMGVWPDDLAALYALEGSFMREEDSLHIVQDAVRMAHDMGNIVIVGRGGQVILKEHPDTLHIRVEAPMRSRIQRIIQRRIELGTEIIEQKEQKQEEWALNIIRGRDQASEDYLKRFYKEDWSNPLLYHLVINTGKVSIQQAVCMIIDLAQKLPVEETKSALGQAVAQK
jgi:CMP/dCMP kinase